MKSVTVRGHFGEYVQGRLGPEGPLALITVPCSRTGVEARLHPDKARQVPSLRAFLASLGLAGDGAIAVSPFSPPGAGTGISTATLVAAALLQGWQGPPERLMAACVAHEGASDPLAFPCPERVLWASREGRILHRMPPLPANDIIGGYFGASRPTNPLDTDFPDVSDLVRDWAGACGLRDIARLASESARRCLRRRGPADDPTERLASRLGAVGFVIAHTGSARGLIFPKGEVPRDVAFALEAAGLAGVVRFGSDDP